MTSQRGSALSTSRQPHNHEDENEIRDENLDKTIADSFPASDPPSSIPDPEEEEDEAGAA